MKKKTKSIVGPCSWCERNGQELVATLDHDKSRYVCETCHLCSYPYTTALHGYVPAKPKRVRIVSTPKTRLAGLLKRQRRVQNDQSLLIARQLDNLSQQEEIAGKLSDLQDDIDEIVETL